MMTAKEILNKNDNFWLTEVDIIKAMQQYAKLKCLEMKDRNNAIIMEIEDIHPYKKSGNRDSYSKYNEGWSDACDIIRNRINQLPKFE